MESIPYHALSINECLKKTETTKNGLKKEQALERLKKYGANVLPETEKHSAIKIFLAQFYNPLIYILFVAAAITLFTKHFVDFTIITAVILISSIVGFIQEFKANNSLSELKNFITYRALVLRGEKEIALNAEQIVPGDIVFLTAGDKIPADIRIIEAQNFEVIEASLTGESSSSIKNTDKLPVGTALAERENMAFFGTVAAKGKAIGVVVGTGLRTEIGKISKLIKETKEEPSNLQKQLIFLGRFIGFFLVGLSIILVGFGIFTGQSWLNMFLIAVSVVVAAVPEGILPALTVILAVGMKRIHKNHGLVRKMSSAETLGAVSVICSDKTGTLTTGVMQISHIATGYELLHKTDKALSEAITEKNSDMHALVIKSGFMCNNAVIENPEEDLTKWKIIGDQTERALLIAGYNAGLNKDAFEKEEHRIAEIPFDSEYKFMATMHSRRGKPDSIYAKGAPEKILDLSEYIDINGKTRKLTKNDMEKIKQHQQKFSSTGLRVLGIAHSSNKNNYTKENFTAEKLKGLTFIGLVALRDPLRDTAKNAIELCRSAGIHTVMITGDHKITAKAIANELGLRTNAENIIEGKDLEKMSDEELIHAISHIDIYARVEPKHKIRIVSAWQKHGHIVGMTGDGVNDAPALKKADIGIALGSGTDVAKETSEIVLLDNNFSTIVSSIKRGRIIFNNIRKVVVYLMCDSFTELTLIGGTLFINFFLHLELPLPLIPAQILWIKIAEDAAPAMALAFDDIDDGVMEEPPRKMKEKILPNRFKLFIMFYSIIMDITLLALFYYIWKSTDNINFARTFAFAGLGFTSFFFIFSARSLKTYVFRINPLKNKYVIGSVIIGLSLLIIAVYVPFFHSNILYTVPFGRFEWGLIFAYTALSIFIFELGKRVFLMNRKKTPKAAIKKRRLDGREQPGIIA